MRADFAREQPFQGLTVAICLHLEPKTANLGLTIKAGGATVVMCPSNPLSTQDSTVCYLQRHLTCFGKRGEEPADYHRHSTRRWTFSRTSSSTMARSCCRRCTRNGASCSSG